MLEESKKKSDEVKRKWLDSDYERFSTLKGKCFDEVARFDYIVIDSRGLIALVEFGGDKLFHNDKGMSGKVKFRVVSSKLMEHMCTLICGTGLSRFTIFQQGLKITECLMTRYELSDGYMKKNDLCYNKNDRFLFMNIIFSDEMSGSLKNIYVTDGRQSLDGGSNRRSFFL